MANPLTWVEAPPRKPRPYTSLDVIPVHDVTAEHFVGFQFTPDPCAFPNPLPQDCYVQYGPAAGTSKSFGDPNDTLSTTVFGAYQGIECSLNGGLDDFRAVAERVLENGEYRVVDGALVALIVSLAAGLPAADPPIVTSNLADVLGGVEEFLAAEVPGQGYIYATMRMITRMVAENLLVRNLDGTLETFLGTPVVPVSEPSAGFNIWFSGPVNLWRSPVNLVDAPSWTTNTGRALAERLYSLSIECGAWGLNYAPATPVVQNPPDDPDEPLEMNLGSIPSSPIPDGTDTTIIVQTNVAPQNEVVLWYSVNGDPAVEAGEMTETGSHEFVWNVVGDSTTAGDSVEVWAVSEYDGAPVESNHITIDVT